MHLHMKALFHYKTADIVPNGPEICRALSDITLAYSESTVWKTEEFTYLKGKLVDLLNEYTLLEGFFLAL